MEGSVWSPAGPLPLDEFTAEETWADMGSKWQEQEVELFPV